MAKSASDQADRPRAGLPASGLADELIPMLRKKRAEAAIPVRPETSAPLLLFADEVAPAAAAVAGPATLRSLVCVELDNQGFALPTEQVLEVLRVGRIARVPNAPRHIRGVVSARGRALPVVELRTCMGLAPLVVDKGSRVLAVQSFGRTLGLLVDRVVDVRTVAIDHLLDRAPADAGIDPRFVAAVHPLEHRELLLLAVDALLEHSA